MVLAGNEGPSQSELDRTINMLIERQTRIDKRVERLETLEGMKRDDGRGCLFYEDYSTATAPATSVSVQFSPTLAPNGNYKGSQALVVWMANSNSVSALENLYMRFNALSTANYYYASKYSKAGALAHINAGAATEMLIGRIPGNSSSPLAHGKFFVNRYPVLSKHQAYGDWTAYDPTVAAASRQEKGEFGGSYVPAGSISISSFTLLLLGGAQFTSVRVYLYGLCPEIVVATGVPGD